MSTRTQRTLRTAVFLAVFGGGTAAYYYATEVRTVQARRAEREEAKRLFHFGRKDVVGVDLWIDERKLSFVREEQGRFVMTAPVRWPANSEAVGALIDRIATMRIEKTLNEGRDGELGIEDPRVRAKVQLASGESYELLVGQERALLEAYVVYDPVSGRTGLAHSDFVWAFERPTDSFRDPHIVPEDPAKLIGIRVFTRSSTVALRREGGAFQLERDEAWISASPMKVQQLMVALTRRLEAERFVTDDFGSQVGLQAERAPMPDNQKAASLGSFAMSGKYGFDAPMYEVELQWPGRTAKLAFVESSKGALLVHRRGTNTVIQVNPLVHTELSLPAKDYEDRRVSWFEPGEVRALRIQDRDSAYRIERRHGRWWRSDQPLLSRKVDPLLRRLAYLEGFATVAVDPSAAELERYGLNPPSYAVRIEFEGKEAQVFRLGAVKGTDMLVYARDKVVVVSQVLLRFMPESQSAWIETE